MITESQQQTLSQLQEFYSIINSLESPPTNMMEEIEAELNKATAKKMKREASEKAAHSMAFEAMTNYVDETVRPLMNKFIKGFSIDIQKNGRMWMGTPECFITPFVIEPSHIHDDSEKEFKKTVFSGFKIDYNRKTMDLHEFDPLLKKFIIGTAKNLDNLY